MKDDMKIFCIHCDIDSPCNWPAFQMEQLKNERWHILEKLIMELERLNQNMTLKDANPGNALRVVGLFFSASICDSFRQAKLVVASQPAPHARR